MIFLLVLFFKFILTQNCSYPVPYYNDFFPKAYHIPVTSDYLEHSENCKVGDNSFWIVSGELSKGTNYYIYMGPFSWKSQVDSDPGGGTGGGSAECLIESNKLGFYVKEGSIPTVDDYDYKKEDLSASSWGSVNFNTKRDKSKIYTLVVSTPSGEASKTNDCYQTIWLCGFYFDVWTVLVIIFLPIGLCCFCCCCTCGSIGLCLLIVFGPWIAVGLIIIIIIAVSTMGVGTVLGGIIGLFSGGGIFGTLFACWAFFCCCCQSKGKDGYIQIENNVRSPLIQEPSINGMENGTGPSVPQPYYGTGPLGNTAVEREQYDDDSVIKPLQQSNQDEHDYESTVQQPLYDDEHSKNNNNVSNTDNSQKNNDYEEPPYMEKESYDSSLYPTINSQNEEIDIREENDDEEDLSEKPLITKE